MRSNACSMPAWAAIAQAIGGTLRKHGCGQALTFASRARLGLTGYINYSNAILWKLWGNLEDAVREGTNRWQQTFGWDGPIFSNFFRTEESMREFLMAMHGYGLISSPHVVAAFDLSRFQPLDRPGRGDRAPRDRRLRAIPRPESRRLRLAGSRAARPRNRRRLDRCRPDRDRLGRLLRRSASRGRPLQRGPNSPRLDRSQGPHSVAAHLRAAARRAAAC